MSAVAVSAALCLTAWACSGPPLDWRDRGLEDPEPSTPGELQDYKESHYRALGAEFVAELAFDDLVEELRDARFLFLGDHHHDTALHERHRALLRRLVDEAGFRIALAVEALGVQDEPALHAYLAGEFGLERLRELVRMRWDGSWLDHDRIDSAHYRALLAFARARSIPVWALEPVPRLPLERRDPWIAARLRSLAHRVPDHLVVVVVGHAHLLGRGALVERVRLPAAAIGARLSVTLQNRLAERAVAPDTLLKSDAGVLFFAQQD